MKNITIKQLRAFITVSREKNFTRAASQLGLSQSALTIAVRQLEQEINLKLFDRSTRSVQLTVHGSAFLPTAEGLLDELSRALEDLSAIAARQKGNVVVAATASFMCSVLAPTVAALAKKYPGLRIKLLNTPENLARRVLEEEIDFGIANIWQPVQALESHLLLEDRFGIVCPARHPLSKLPDQLVWSDLKKQPMVTMASGASVRDIMDRHKNVSAYFEDPACEVSSIFALGALIEHKVGIATLPALVARQIVSKNLVFRPLHRPIIKRDLFVIKRRGRSLTPAALEVIRFMMMVLEDIGTSPYIDVQPAASLLAGLSSKERATASA
jgi:DNA-binding transcriptional LysR family regulator